MIEALLLGTAAGTFAGLFPGVGPFLAMLMLLPVVSGWDALNILVCYAALMQVSQSVTTVTAVYTGVAGETASMPTVREIPHLNADQRAQALMQSAVGSFVAAILAITVCWMLSQYLNDISYVFRTEVIATLFILAAVLVVRNTTETRTMSILLLVLGGVLGMIGFNNNLQANILTFGNIYLMQGLPMEIVFLMLFVIPQVYQMSGDRLKIMSAGSIWQWPRNRLLPMVQSSTLGFLGGLMPGLGTTFSSLLSYNVRSRQTEDRLERVVATETANNAGAVAVLIPMLLFGLPMVAGEALTINLMEATGYTPGVESAAEFINKLAPWLMLSSVLALTLSWPLATLLLHVLRSHMSVIRALILATMTSIVLIQSWQDYTMTFTLTCMVALAPLTYWLRGRDTMGLIFGFLVAERCLDYFLRLYTLYS